MWEARGTGFVLPVHRVLTVLKVLVLEVRLVPQVLGPSRLGRRDRPPTADRRPPSAERRVPGPLVVHSAHALLASRSRRGHAGDAVVAGSPPGAGARPRQAVAAGDCGAGARARERVPAERAGPD